jgi:hypothetical protein
MIRELFLGDFSLSSCVWQSTIFLVVGLVSSFILKHRSARAQELKAKGMAIAAVQASKIDENSLDEWRKKHNIPFPFGMVQGDEDRALFTLGVPSLPCLILTDSQHVVAAEGFRLSELDAKIEQIDGD